MKFQKLTKMISLLTAAACISVLAPAGGTGRRDPKRIYK